MRFLVDESTGPAVAEWLEGQQHEVFSVYAEARGADDDWIIEKAGRERWILITNDKDFGEKVFRERHVHRGIILLRLQDERAANKIEVLHRFLAGYAEQIVGRFAVVTENRCAARGSIHQIGATRLLLTSHFQGARWSGGFSMG